MIGEMHAIMCQQVGVLLILNGIHLNAIEGDVTWQVFIEAIDCLRSAVEVFGITSDTPRVEVRFENLGTKDIVGDVDIVSILCIEC